MSHPLLQLQALFTKRTARVSGKVVRTNGSEVYVATDRGPVSVRRKNDGTDYRPGDSVLLRDGELVGRLRDENNIPVFFI